MTTASVAKRPPTFTTEVSVHYMDVDINPSELEEAGWVYVGDQEAVRTTEQVLDIVRRWHDREHPQPWQFCDHDLCREVVA